MSNIGKDIKQSITHVSGNISNAAGVIIGSNIHVEGGINVTNVIKEIESFGLNFLPPDYFELHKSSKKDFNEWKNGFPFELHSIMSGLDFKRINIINNIITRLEDKNSEHALLLVGKSGTSKSNLVKEIICHYFKNGYIVFYNFGEEEIKDVYDLTNSLRNRLKDGNKILVAVDNVHDKRTIPIFSIIDSLQSFENKDNIRFILAGRLPEFDRCINERLNEIPSEQIRRSIRKLSKKLRFETPNFDPKEIKEFIKKYKNEEEIKNSLIQKYSINVKEYDKIFNEGNRIDNISYNVFKETDGYPILIKFFLFGKGLYEDMRSRYDEYLANDNNIMKLHTMLICAILDRADLSITDNILSEMKIITYARELKNQTLIFSEIEKKWKTIHPKWDLELITYLYSEEDDYILEKRIEILKKSLESLMTIIKSEKEQYLIIGSLYDSTTIDTEQNKILPIDVIDQVIRKNEISYVDNLSEFWRFDIYALYIAKNYFYLKRYKEALNALEKVSDIYPNDKSFKKTFLLNKGIFLVFLHEEKKAIESYDQIINEFDSIDITAWYGKAFALERLGKGEEAIECYDKIINELDPKHFTALNRKGITLDKLGRHQEAIECYDGVLEVDSNNKYVLMNKGDTLLYLGKYEEAIEYFDKVLSIDPNYVDALEHKKFAEEKSQNRNK